VNTNDIYLLYAVLHGHG